MILIVQLFFLCTKILCEDSYINSLEGLIVHLLFSGKGCIIIYFDITVDMTSVELFLHSKFDNFS